MSNFLADKSFLAIKPQVDAVTPIIPSLFFPLSRESVRVNPNFSADRRLKGLSWKSDELLNGPRMVEGDLEVLACPDIMGHLLNMCYTKGSTTGDGTVGYTHPFTVGEGKSYTIEIPRGTYAQRIYGVRGESLKLAYQDNKLNATLAIKGLGQFYGASLGIALTGAAQTTAVLSEAYGPRPSDGLCVGDVLQIVETAGTTVNVTLLTVNADGKTVTFASTAITAAVGQPVYLVAQTPTMPTFREPFYMAGTLIGVGVDRTAADTAAASRTTAQPCYDVSMDLKNNLFDAQATGYMGPAVLLNQVREGQITLSRLFATPAQFEKWVDKVKQAMTLIATGRSIKTDLTTFHKLSIHFSKVKLMTNEEALEVGQYVFDKQTLEALYDSSDAKAVEIELVNLDAGTVY